MRWTCLLLYIFCCFLAGCTTLGTIPNERPDPIQDQVDKFNDDLNKMTRPQDIMTLYKSFTVLNTINYKKWHSPKETLISKEGDCKDFAVLTKYLLRNMDINSHIYVIKFKQLTWQHAINVFFYRTSYFIFTNKELIRTTAPTKIMAILQIYPDAETVIEYRGGK